MNQHKLPPLIFYIYLLVLLFIYLFFREKSDKNPGHLLIKHNQWTSNNNNEAISSSGSTSHTWSPWPPLAFFTNKSIIYTVTRTTNMIENKGLKNHGLTVNVFNDVSIGWKSSNTLIYSIDNHGWILFKNYSSKPNLNSKFNCSSTR